MLILASDFGCSCERELTGQLASNPVLSGRVLIRCATKCRVNIVISPKVLFFVYTSASAIKLTACGGTGIAIDMPRIALPRSHSAFVALNSPYVNIFICVALFIPNSKQIVAFQLCACVVSVHKTIIREVAGGS